MLHVMSALIAIGVTVMRQTVVIFMGKSSYLKADNRTVVVA